MSALQKLIARPWFWLAGVLVACILAGADSLRAPNDQILVSVGSSMVRGYQKYGRPMLPATLVCRYDPCCSEYALQALRNRGFRGGSWLAIKRIARCNRHVTPGTPDPVDDTLSPAMHHQPLIPVPVLASP
jgi:putative membrane protein insertion efficiency factor